MSLQDVCLENSGIHESDFSTSGLDRSCAKRQRADMTKTRRGPGGKIQADSFPELKAWLDTRAIAVRDLPGVKERGERFQSGHLLEAVALWFAAQPPAVQLEVVREGRRLARLMDRSPGVGPDELAGPGGAGNPGHVDDDAGWRALTRVPLPPKGLADSQDPPVKDPGGRPKRRR